MSKCTSSNLAVRWPRFGTVITLCSAAIGFGTSITVVASESAQHLRNTIKVVELEDVVPTEGLLLRRTNYTYDMYKRYTAKHVLSLNYSTQPSDHAFPGDTIGRFIMSTTLLSRILHQPEPDSLKQVMAALPSMVNTEGYLGWIMPKDRADETGLANIMWCNGLTEYCRWTKKPAAMAMDRNLVTNVILPVKEAYYYYYVPEKNDGKIKWVHCTGDTAQAFGIIDPATRAYSLFPSAELATEINELIRLYRKLDHVQIQAQIHAVLFSTRGILRWYELQGNPEHLEFAESLYRKYRAQAMTENYENYNWFGRPEWTEGCAIVDSLTVALKLWQLTGKSEYLEDAQLILFNGLLANQQGCGGDFGTNNCVGAKDDVLLRHRGSAPFCCSVWGGKGFARSIQYSQFTKPDGLIVTIFGNNLITARLPDGDLTVKQTTGYPFAGGVKFEIIASASNKPRDLQLFMPSWIVPQTVKVSVNGEVIAAQIQKSYLTIRRPMKVGDRIDVAFQQAFRTVLPLYSDRMPGYHRYLYGPLLLGLDTAKEQALPQATPLQSCGDGAYRTTDGTALTLIPLCNLMDVRDEAHRARSNSAQVLFKD